MSYKLKNSNLQGIYYCQHNNKEKVIYQFDCPCDDGRYTTPTKLRLKEKFHCENCGAKHMYLVTKEGNYENI